MSSVARRIVRNLTGRRARRSPLTGHHAPLFGGRNATKRAQRKARLVRSLTRRLANALGRSHHQRKKLARLLRAARESV